MSISNNAAELAIRLDAINGLNENLPEFGHRLSDRLVA